MENSSAPNIPSPLRKSIKATTASSASPSAKTQTSASSVAAAAATKLDKEVVFEFGGPFGVSVMMVSQSHRGGRDGGSCDGETRRRKRCGD